jgi:predicted transcriptional regulator
MADAPIPPPVVGAEAEALAVLWQLGEAPVRAVMDELNRAAPAPRAYTTYMTMLGRLHAKGLLAKRREDNTDYYRPVYSRAEYADLRARAEVEAIVDAFGDVALGHFARQMAQLDPERRRELERLADEA